MAERLGFDHDEALTLGRALAGLTAHTMGVRLGIFEPPSSEDITARHRQFRNDEQLHVRLLGRDIEVDRTSEGFRAIEKGKPAKPAAVTKYLAGKFGDDLAAASMAMVALAESFPPAELHRRAIGQYERARPVVPSVSETVSEASPWFVSSTVPPWLGRRESSIPLESVDLCRRRSR